MGFESIRRLTPLKDFVADGDRGGGASVGRESPSADRHKIDVSVPISLE